jgi:hypothetical protein
MAWYIRRLARMSPAEIAHRVVEQGRRMADRRQRWGWDRFGDFGGPIAGLPGFHPEAASAALLEEAERAAAKVRDGRLHFLGQDWPHWPSGWWRQDLWRLDPASGLSWPGAGSPASASYRKAAGFGDVKFVWEINRLQFLVPMALAARRAGGEGAGEVFDILAGWMAANPPFEGVNWTGGIEAASRIVSILAVWSCLGDYAEPADAVRVRAFLHAHVLRIARYPSLYSSANNHRVAELAGCALATLAAPGLPKAAGLRRASLAGLEQEALRQFHADGVGAEQSPTYAAYSLEWFTLAGAAGDAAGAPFSAAYRGRLQAAAEHLSWLLDEAGHTPRIGDDDEGRVLSLGPEEDYPASVAALTGRWLGLPRADTPLRLPLRDLVCPGDVPRAAPLLGVRTFEQGGYTVGRVATSQGLGLWVFDHGPLGFLSIAAHGHADALSVWLHLGDEPVLADAGTYLYHAGGTWRDRFRGTAAHNTLAIDDQDQSEIAGPFNWSGHASTELVAAPDGGIAAETGAFADRFGLRHRRTVRWGAGGDLTVEDALSGNPVRSGLTWSAGYTLGPGVTAVLEGAVARLTTPKGRGVTLTVEAGPSWGLTEGLYSPAFNVRSPAQRLVLAGALDQSSPGLVSRVAILLGG